MVADGRLGLSKKFNSSRDAAGKGVKVVMTPKAVVSLLGIRIIDIQCGAAHTIAREAIEFAEDKGGGGDGDNESARRHSLKTLGVGLLGEGNVAVKGGRLFSWGKGENGRLGHGDTQNQGLPKQIKGIVSAVAAATEQSVVDARSSGLSTSMAGGHPLSQADSTTAAAAAAAGGSNFMSSAVVVSISCGWSFSAAATLGGSVLCWGRGREGQLGYRYTGDETRPCHLEDPRFGCANGGVRPWAARTVACGYTHTLVLAERHPGSVLMAEGLNAAAISRPTAVFSWGYGEKGELGTASPHRPVPEQLSFPDLIPGDAIVSVTSGSLHCAALTHFGEVYVWGCNRHGALGVRSANDVWTPLRVSLTKLRAAAGMDAEELMECSPTRSRQRRAYGQEGVQPALRMDRIRMMKAVHPTQISCGERCTLILVDRQPIQSIHENDGKNHLSGSGAAADTVGADVDAKYESDKRNGDLLPLPAPLDMHRAVTKWYTVEGTRNQRVGSHSIVDAPLVSSHKSRSSSLPFKERGKKDIRNLRRDSKIWKSEILPHWEKTLEAPSRKLLRQQCSSSKSVGVPPGLRRRVWPLLIENALRITPELFQMYRKRAQGRVWMRRGSGSSSAFGDSSGGGSGRSSGSGGSSSAARSPTSKYSSEQTRTSPRRSLAIGKESSLNLIDVDLARTFPTLRLFGEEGAYHHRLREVLETYACYRPDLGYVQGMSYIAALMCLYMTDTYTAFYCLANVMVDSKTHFFAFFNLSGQRQALGSLSLNRPEEYYACFSSALAAVSKSLAKRMRELSDNGLEPAAYLFNWLQTAYLRVLPLGIASRVWDLFLIDGTPFLFRVGVALLVMHKKWLKSSPFEDCARLLTNHPSKRHMWDTIDEATLFKAVDKIDLSKTVEQRLGRLTH